LNTVFYISAAVAIISTIMVITRLNTVHALLYLIVSLLSVALIFFVLGAPFVAALEVVIYAGAIMVLFVFVIMMLNLGAETVEQERQWLTPEIWAGPLFLTLILVAELIYIFTRNGLRLCGVCIIEPKKVGIVLFGSYLLGVELASILLLVALIGAYHLGKHFKPAESRKGGS